MERPSVSVGPINPIWVFQNPAQVTEVIRPARHHSIAATAMAPPFPAAAAGPPMAPRVLSAVASHLQPPPARPAAAAAVAPSPGSSEPASGASAAWLPRAGHCAARPAGAAGDGSGSKLHIIVLMGQSNMAGRGVMPYDRPAPDPDILNFHYEHDTWEPAADPLHLDRNVKANLSTAGAEADAKRRAAGQLYVNVGVGPGLGFAQALKAARGGPGRIGVVPCAFGGTHSVSAHSNGATAE
eukprot:SAG22_NODE_62_length_23371_cov_84.500602_14_plen_240_part_00